MAGGLAAATTTTEEIADLGGAEGEREDELVGQLLIGVDPCKHPEVTCAYRAMSIWLTS